MSIRVRDAAWRAMTELRHEPTEKRIRVQLGGATIADTTGALLVWEPRRPVPSYAVPAADLRADLTPAAPVDVTDALRAPVLPPNVPFAAHSSPGTALDVTAGGQTRAGAAFRADDPELADHVVLDFRAFDAWMEEDEPLVSHPRDPYHRIDVRRSSRHIRVGRDGHLLAESTRPTLVFETNLPVRFYLAREDLRADAVASDRRTACAYKGRASYWSFPVLGDDGRDLAWSYEDPLADAAQLTGLVAFFDDLVDVELDGELRARPDSPLARSIVEGARGQRAGS
jgi:uncharacterized protein (DUF427 family)